MTIRHENDELEFRFERRRYGSTTYTWAEVNHGGRWLSCGDPWPCVTPKRAELVEAAIAAIGKAVAP